MINTAVRFEYSTNGEFSGSYENFYEEEIIELSVLKKQGHVLFKNFDKSTGIIRTGFPYHIFTVTFNLAFGYDTLTKIENLFLNRYGSQPDFLRLYYNYLEDTSSSSIVKMIRQDMKWSYSSGRLDNKPIKIRFVETNLEGVGMLYTLPSNILL